MRDRSQKILRRVGVALLSIAVVFLIIAEDIFELAGLLLRKILPADFAVFLRSQSTVFTYGVVGIAVAIHVVFSVAESGAFWLGYYWIGIGISLLSKVYTFSVLDYLCRVYSDRLLAVGWIKKSWKWYLASKEWLKSFQVYKIAHAFYERIKARVVTMVRHVRKGFKGRSLFSIARRLIRLKRRH